MSGAETINSAVRERPILFSGPMVRAILEGRKTQTRRVIRPQPMVADEFDSATMTAAWQSGDVNVRCPYGQPGDRLWVRESAYIAPKGFDPVLGRVIDKDGEKRVVSWAASMDDDAVRCASDYGVKCTPSIHMPRWASRLTLEITEVRVERLNEISEEDAKAEGYVSRLAFLTGDFAHSLPDATWLWAISFKPVDASGSSRRQRGEEE